MVEPASYKINKETGNAEIQINVPKCLHSDYCQYLVSKPGEDRNRLWCEASDESILGDIYNNGICPKEYWVRFEYSPYVSNIILLPMNAHR